MEVGQGTSLRGGSGPPGKARGPGRRRKQDFSSPFSPAIRTSIALLAGGKNFDPAAEGIPRDIPRHDRQGRLFDFEPGFGVVEKK